MKAGIVKEVKHMICPKCGLPLPEDSTACQACGYVTADNKKAKRKQNALIRFCHMTAFLVILVLFSVSYIETSYDAPCEINAKLYIIAVADNDEIACLNYTAPYVVQNIAKTYSVDYTDTKAVAELIALPDKHRIDIVKTVYLSSDDQIVIDYFTDAGKVISLTHEYLNAKPYITERQSVLFVYSVGIEQQKAMVLHCVKLDDKWYVEAAMEIPLEKVNNQ